MTRQRPSVQPWKVLELKKSPASEPARALRREHVKVVPKVDRVGPIVRGIVNALIVVAGCAVAAAPLARFAFRRAGYNPVRYALVALDGHSVLLSSGFALGTLAATITLAIMARFARPRSFGYMVAALGALVIALATIAVAFTAGPAGAPLREADALLRWALPFVPLGIALRAWRNAWASCVEGEAKTRVRGFFGAAFASAIAFVAMELFFGAGLARLLPWLH